MLQLAGAISRANDIPWQGESKEFVGGGENIAF